MPTSINVAKQCLTAESSHALEESVNVARRRGHSQTTSLHAVSALLSLPTSILRDACALVRNSAYSPRLQFKALELSLFVSLDRIQSGQPGSDNPPVSNSFMAAIKRSQAHQRRLPENFRIYQEMSSQNQNSISCVKVELRQLILSILDDPVVSRVFGEAGFRSSELKLSIIRPIPHLLRYSSHQPLLRPYLPHHKSSLMGSFVPFGGFFSTPDLKLPFSGFNKEITGPVSSVSDQTQSTLPPWLRMSTRRDLNPKSSAKINEGLESVCGKNSTSSVSASTGSAKSVITDLNLRIYPCLKKHESTSSSCLDNPRDLNAESFKIIYRRLTDSVLGQDEAARVISYALSQPPKNTTRRDVWLNLVGSDTVSKRRMSLVLAEIVYQSEHRFMAVDLGVAEHDDVMQLRGKTMVDHIFEVMCRNPFCVVFLENIEKADEKLQISLLKAIETGKFMDSHGREVGIGNTMFVMTSSIEDFDATEEKLLRGKDKQMEIWIETESRLPNVSSVSNLSSRWKPSSMHKRKLMGLEKALETGKRLNRTSNGVLDLNLPAQETETDETYEENSNIWLTKLKNHDRLIEVPFKPFDFEGLAKRIRENVKETFDKTVRSDCLLEIDPKIMERILATVYFSDNRKDMIKELMEKEMARVFLKVKERYEITTSCVVKLVGRSLEVFREDQMDLFVVRSH